jgi:phospholipid/cholesterol/gamma-HCH transport system permease protein
VSSIATASIASVASLRDRTKDGVVTSGNLVILAIASVWALVTDILARRFSWSEFMLQAWFMTRVSLLPTILVAIPFGVITSVQIGAVANQIGATSFSGAVNGIGVLRQGAPLVTSLMIAGAVGSAICADLGARTVREEIDALKVMGISPIQRLVAPRILAALVVAALLTVIVAMNAVNQAVVLSVILLAVTNVAITQAYVMIFPQGLS